MYCPVKMQNLACVLNELLLWSHISSEHPVFIKTVAELSKKNLPENLEEKLQQISKSFKDIQKETAIIKRSLQTGSLNPMATSDQVLLLIGRFLKYDEYVIMFYPEFKKYGKDDMVWQQQIEHILHEQKFMHQLFSELHDQLGR